MEDFAGSGVCTGKVQKAGYPYPGNPKFAVGVLRRILRYDLATRSPTHYIDTPVAIHTISFGHDDPREEEWDVSLTWVASGGNPTIVWGGSQVAISTPNPYDQQVYAGMTKTYDANGLLSGATQRFYCKGISDSDAAEVAKLVSMVASASAPINNLKVLTATLAQRTSSDGIFIDINYALQDSKDQQETPQNIQLTDPNALTSYRQLALVYSTGFPPATPAAPSGQKLIDYTDRKLNDQYYIRIYRWGLKDSKDDVELPRETTTTDAQNLQDIVTIAQVWSGTPPADPSAPLGSDGNALKLINKKDESLTAPDTSGKLVRVWTYGRNDSKDDIERSIRHGSFSEYDPNTLDGSARITRVALTASPPSTPSPPISGVKYAQTITRPLTDQYSIYMFEYAPLDSKDKLQLTETMTDGAAVALDTVAQIPLVDGSPSAPSGLKLIRTQYRDLPNSHILTTGIFGLKDSNDKITMDGSEVRIGIYPVDNTEQKVEIASCLATDTLEDLAQAKYLAVKDTLSPTQDAPFRSLRARRYHSKAVIYTTVWAVPTGWIKQQTDKIEIKGNYGPIKAKSWVGFNGSNIPSVSVLSCLTRGTGKYLVQLGQFETLGVGGPLTVYKTYSGSVPPLGTSSILRTNSSAFLGFPIGSVMYLGASYDVTVVSGGTTTYNMAYQFTLSITANWVGFPTITGIPVGGLIHTTTSVSAGALLPGSGGPPTYTWSALPGVSCTLPLTDAFSFQTWSQ
jgi:hypothetical protein